MNIDPFVNGLFLSEHKIISAFGSPFTFAVRFIEPSTFIANDIFLYIVLSPFNFMSILPPHFFINLFIQSITLS
jgi:hypothetical protein